MRRTWAVGVVALALVASGGWTLWRETRDTCGTSVVSQPASRSSSPFLDADAQREQPDADRDALVASLGRSLEVVGAVGYHYEQWADVSSYAEGLGVRTRDNPDFTLLDDSLRPRWSVAVGAARSTYDADGSHYVVTTLPRAADPSVVSLDLATGERVWCARLEGVRLGRDGSVATQLLGDDVAVLAGDRLVRFDGEGGVFWRSTPRAGTGDFLGLMTDELLLAGGSDRATVLDPAAVAGARPGRSLAALALESGEPVWTRDSPAGTVEHVVGTDAGVAVVESRTASGGRLLGLDDSGREVWSIDTGAKPVDAALRSGRLLVRSQTTFTAYDVGSGEQQWRRYLPNRPQLLPYGFELGSAPLLDDDHLLLATTTRLVSLDVADGGLATLATLPTDGINTTYWPYQVALTDDLLAVATNTGAVVLERD